MQRFFDEGDEFFSQGVEGERVRVETGNLIGEGFIVKLIFYPEREVILPFFEAKAGFENVIID